MYFSNKESVGKESIILESSIKLKIDVFESQTLFLTKLLFYNIILIVRPALPAQVEKISIGEMYDNTYNF